MDAVLVPLQNGWCGPAGSPDARPIELGVFLLIGLLGSAHCLGMCGPLVSVYADRMNDGADSGRRRRRTRGRSGPAPVSLFAVRQHLLFNAGRVTVYTLLGGLFGLGGALVFETVPATGWVGLGVRAAVGLALGLVIVAAGLEYVVGGAGTLLAAELPVIGRASRRVYGLLSNRVDRWVGSPRIFGLGFAHGFLPCPLIYPAFLYALALGNPLRGGLVLFLLGLGTVPALLVYGTVVQSLGLGHRRILHRALGALFVVLGTHTVLMSLRLLGLPVPDLFALPVYQPLF
jgi:sulfite exporter TauE/SafE